ncbi:hemolysin family protein [Methanobacterium sp.]|uniref:hemolysin family protein n=1 Tax=Methanobacterium sp. TaxID=2164 RepID=UPI0025D00D49|nr:hemolysin family protein [Methanobacterium sp.]MBI5458158.1 HlyC/CorC family transporter [Methanobacterium sp.]
MELIYLEILIILFLIVLNGVFALSEIAIITSRRIKLQKMSQDGNKNADIAIELSESPNQFLSTVQIGITLIGILAGAFGGATIAQTISSNLEGVAFLQPYSEALGFLVVVLIITYLSLIVGELVPKRIALNNPEQIAVKIAKPMKYISKITSPLVVLLSFSMELVLKILQIKESNEENVSEEEIKLLIEEGTQTGEFEKTEEDIIKRVFMLDDRRASSLMTPKTGITWLDVDESVADIKSKITESKRAMFPVGKNSLDNFLGVIQLKDLFEVEIEDGVNLQEYIKSPIIVPESSDVLDILNLFKESKDNVHMAIVVDEYGSIEGLITLNDILEAIVGEIPAIDEPDEPKAVQRPDGSWLMDGAISVEEFKDILNVKNLPGEEMGVYQTLGGFILDYLGKIPDTGESFQSGDVNFEVVDMDGHHIDKVLVYHT